jgi:hypothetical protein
MSGSALRRVTAMALAVAGLGVLGVLAPLATAPAQAAQYRYWTYWWGAGSGWQYASLGPAYDSARIGNGFVLGWRFGVTGPNGGGSSPPRHSAGYDSFHCPPTPAGQVGVALVVDFGTAADQPPGDHRPLTGAVLVSCVTLAPHSNGITALGQAGVSFLPRASDGLVCALDGYPSTECAAVVADPTPAPTRTAAPTPTRPAPNPTSPAGAGTGTTGTATGSRTTSPGSPGPAGSPSAGTPARSPGASVSASAPAVGAASPSGPSAEQTLPATSALAVAGADTTSAGTPWPVIAVLVLVAGLGAGTWWARRRSGP